MKSILTLVVTVLYLGLGLYAQDQVFAKFKIVDEKGEQLKGCKVTLYEGNDVAEIKEKTKAKVKLYMNLDQYYTIEVKMKGYATKRIAFDTRIGDEVLDRNVFDFFVEMQNINQYVGAPNSEDVLDYPITVIQYDEGSELFDYNSEYTRNSVAAVRELKRQILMANSESISE